MLPCVGLYACCATLPADCVICCGLALLLPPNAVFPNVANAIGFFSANPTTLSNAFSYKGLSPSKPP